jgi:hypothetical protein
MKILKNYWLLIGLLSIYGFQCDDCDERINNTYSFSIGNELNAKEYNLGDTLFLSANLKSTLILDNGLPYEMNDQNFYLNMEIVRLRENNQPSYDGLKYFELIDYQGISMSRYDGIINTTLSFSCRDEKCLLKIGLKTLEKGYYVFIQGHGSFNNEQDECEVNQANAYLSDGFDNNAAICKEIMKTRLVIDNTGRSIYDSLPISSRGLYFFKVI